MTLKERRKALNLTQERVAARMGVRANQVSQIENGNNGNPTMDTLEKLALAVEWTVPELIAAIRETSEAA